ncbi:dynein beta chain, ciliary-like protein [Sarcoptes scabiei]|uniref:Dynein beta chain, ciliary-like protein n=1 Tax=Sarcoptes scabiei TaxID=52283 RepID=A0A131ZZ11_SARSC|nr:dynein beta chain, ciliary-like protein [Sarcoptes scabiei]
MDPLKRLDLSKDDERNQQFEKLILTTIKNYFRLPWLNLTEKETSIVDRFVNENLHRTNKTEQRQRQQSQRSQSSKTTCLLIELDKDNVDVSSVSKNYINLEVGVGNEGSKDNDDNQVNNVGLRFQIVPVEKLKSLRPSQKRSNNYRQHHRISPNQADRHQKSIIFVPIVPSGSILASYLNHGEDGMKNLDRNQTVRLITDDEAIKLLADILNQSTSSNDDITLALKQLERFLDREHKIWNERREFLRKLSQWTENLLEIDSDENEDNDGDDYNRNDLNFNRINQNKLIDSSKQSDSGNDSNVNSENDEDDKNEDDGGVDSKQNEKNQLEKLSRKIIILKQRNKLLDEIVTNFAILFHDVPNYEQNRDELVETSKLLASELNQLFHRWKVSVSNELQQDLTKRCIIIDEDSSVPIITFSLNLERYVDLAKQFEEIGIEIPNEIKQIETRFAKYFGIVRDLQKIVLFYMTVAEKILPSQRSLLLDKAQAFTSLLESQQKLTWSDPIATIEQWVDRLKRFMNEFNEENSLLQQSHRRILEIIKWTVEESIDQWPKMINQIKLILSSSLNRPEIDTYTWRKHWDYQLYKILEYNFTHLFRDRNPTRISVSIENSEWNSQFELFLSPQSIRVNLKFDSNGLVIYEPSIEILKQNLFEQYQTIVRFPSRLKAFVDWSLDAELNPIDSSSSSMVTHTLFHNIYFRNAKNFSQIYQRLFDAWNELIEIRSRFLQWSALYALVREIQSIAIGSDLNDDRNDGKNGDSQEREDVKKRFHFETLDDYQYNLNLIQKFHQEFSQNYSMINEIQCRHSSYLINIIPIKMFAEWLRNEIDLVLLRNLQTRCLQEMRSLEEDCGKFRDSIHKIPSTIDELIEIDALVEKKLNDFCSEKQLAMIKVREKMQFLENWSASMTSLKSNELAERFDRIKTIQNELNTIRENRNEILERQRFETN